MLSETFKNISPIFYSEEVISAGGKNMLFYKQALNPLVTGSFDISLRFFIASIMPSEQ